MLHTCRLFFIFSRICFSVYILHGAYFIVLLKHGYYYEESQRPCVCYVVLCLGRASIPETQLGKNA